MKSSKLGTIEYSTPFQAKKSTKTLAFPFISILRTHSPSSSPSLLPLCSFSFSLLILYYSFNIYSRTLSHTLTPYTSLSLSLYALYFLFDCSHSFSALSLRILTLLFLSCAHALAYFIWQREIRWVKRQKALVRERKRECKREWESGRVRKWKSEKVEEWESWRVRERELREINLRTFFMNNDWKARLWLKTGSNLIQ